MQKLLILVFALVTLTTTTSCSLLRNVCWGEDESPCPPPPKPCNKPCRPDSCTIETQILETAQSIESSLTILAAAETAESPPILNTGPLITCEGGMGGTANIDWVGPIGPLVEKIACMTNYRVKILGNEPAIPVLISISAKNVVIADILQNASFQAAKRAQVLVFPCNRVIEVRYTS